MKKTIIDIIVGGTILGTILLVITILYLNKVISSLDVSDNVYNFRHTTIKDQINVQGTDYLPQQTIKDVDLQQTTGNAQNAKNLR